MEAPPVCSGGVYKGILQYENMDWKNQTKIRREEITQMEHGKAALVRVVFSAVYAYFYYCFFRVRK